MQRATEYSPLSAGFWLVRDACDARDLDLPAALITFIAHMPLISCDGKDGEIAPQPLVTSRSLAPTASICGSRPRTRAATA